ncbi:O-methyltransferase [Reyranella sp.]|uniref:O-methyltransferase n=1 Tax=Reyranella sp. TaxID=1929291 RepID=UPI003BABED9C
MGVLGDERPEALLARLHARSDAQIEEMSRRRPDPADAARSVEERLARAKVFVSDKLVALDRDKAEFCYQMCRAFRARRIVEIGTSWGVSNLYLAAAVRDTVAVHGGTGLVIGTEHEPGKLAEARANLAEAGFESFVELREDDLRRTLTTLEGPVDFVLVDIWTDMARPGLERVAPHLAREAVVVCDNTAAHRDAYADYFAFIDDPANGFRTLTLPFAGGLEFSVRSPIANKSQ